MEPRQLFQTGDPRIHIPEDVLLAAFPRRRFFGHQSSAQSFYSLCAFMNAVVDASSDLLDLLVQLLGLLESFLGFSV